MEYATRNYIDFEDIILSKAPGRTDLVVTHKGHSYSESLLDDHLWDNFQYDKYGEDYELGIVEDELTPEIDQEFETWIRANRHIVYEWFELCAENEDADEIQLTED